MSAAHTGWNPLTSLSELPEGRELALVTRLLGQHDDTPGGAMVLVGIRRGDSVYANCDCSFEITHWLMLPRAPAESRH